MTNEEIEAMNADMAAGTPGPWRVDTGDGEVVVGPEGAFEPFGGCGCCGSPWMNGNGPDAHVANARRIARVPELEAEVLRLRGLLHQLDDYLQSLPDGPVGAEVIDAICGIVHGREDIRAALNGDGK